jgi:hypothetical protein
MPITIKIEDLKNKIENMEEIHQIHIGSILRQNPDIKLNSNKSGLLVNLSTIPETLLEEIQKYVDYIFDQENTLTKTEDLKQQYISILNNDCE